MEIIYCPLADSWLCRARLSLHRNSGYKTSVAERLQRRALQGRSPSSACFTGAGVSEPGLQLCKPRRPATIYWAGVALGYPLPEVVLLGYAGGITPPPMWNYWLQQCCCWWRSVHVRHPHKWVKPSVSPSGRGGILVAFVAIAKIFLGTSKPFGVNTLCSAAD